VSSPFSYAFTVSRGREELRLSGEIDIATCPTLVEALNAVVAHPGGDVLLDCSRVTFFGVAGVGALVEARKELDRSGRRLVVRNPSPIVRRVLHIFELADVFADDEYKSADPTPHE
jgi:anti-anti-sigma factor